MSILLDNTETLGLVDREPIAVENALPAKDRWVLLLTPSYRYLGYHVDGIWRDVAHGNRIADPVIAWIPLDAPAAAV